MESLFVESENPKMAVCGVKVGQIKSDHKHLT